MEIFLFNYSNIFSFFLTLIRISIVVFLLPFYGGRGIPSLVKAVFCIILTIGIWPNISLKAESLPTSSIGIFILIFGELILGIILSLAIKSIFAGVQTAGAIIGFQMGFSLMNVVDPLSGRSTVLTSHLLYMISLLFFLSFNGHLYLISAFTQSFRLVPPGSILINSQLFDNIIYFTSQIFIIAIKIAAPVMVAELFVSCALGVIARLSPQINVLFVGFPLKIAIGFFFMGIIIEILGFFMRDIVAGLEDIFNSLMWVG